VVEGRPTLVLDAGGYVALGIGDASAAAWYRRAIDNDWDVILPVEVIAEVVRRPMAKGVRDWQRRVLGLVHRVVSPSAADLAGALMAQAGGDDAVDAFVAVAALRAVPAVILTSDPFDLRALLDTQVDGSRVAVVRVDN
jgi:hypothetical protein